MAAKRKDVFGILFILLIPELPENKASLVFPIRTRIGTWPNGLGSIFKASYIIKKLGI